MIFHIYRESYSRGGTKDLLNTGGIDHCREQHDFTGDTSKFDPQYAPFLFWI